MFIPNPRSPIPDPTFFHPGSRIRPVSILTPNNQKNGFLSSRNMIRVVHPGSRIRMLTFYPSRIPDPGSRGQKGTGSRIPANHPPPPEYLLTQDSCKETSLPLLHTTRHNNTQQHYTTALGYINLPMYLLFLWRGT
jgi:hypothetical protein